MNRCEECKHFNKKIGNGEVLDFGYCDKRKEETHKEDICDEYYKEGAK